MHSSAYFAAKHGCKCILFSKTVRYGTSIEVQYHGNTCLAYNSQYYHTRRTFYTRNNVNIRTRTSRKKKDPIFDVGASFGFRIFQQF